MLGNPFISILSINSIHLPYLQIHSFSLYINRFNFKIHSNCTGINSFKEIPCKYISYFIYELYSYYIYYIYNYLQVVWIWMDYYLILDDNNVEYLKLDWGSQV